MSSDIRKITKQDLPLLCKVIDSVELFPSEMLNEMTQDYFNHSSSSSESEPLWFTYTSSTDEENNNQPIAVMYCAPEKMTNGTFNLYLIAVHKAYQGQSIGSKLLKFLENYLKTKNARILLVEISGLENFELTRKFYEKNQYEKHAMIKDFYDEGDDKIIYWKKL